MLWTEVRVRIPDRIEEHEERAYVVAGSNLEKGSDAPPEAGGVLLPQQIVQEDAHGVHADGSRPTELEVDPLRIESVRLPHLERVDRGRGYVVGTEDPGLSRIPVTGLLLAPALPRTRCLRGHAREEEQTEYCASVAHGRHQLVCRETQGRGGAVGHTGFENVRRKVRMVDGVREMLRFEREAAMLPVHHAFLSVQGAVEKVAAVELHTGLGAPHLHDAPRSRLAHSRDEGETLAPIGYHIVVIVTDPVTPHLTDVCANGSGMQEVHRRTRNRRDLARRNERRVNGGVALGIDQQLVPEDIAMLGAGEVEVAVVSEVHGSIA